MGTLIDAKGLACPQPVVLTKRPLRVMTLLLSLLIMKPQRRTSAVLLKNRVVQSRLNLSVTGLSAFLFQKKSFSFTETASVMTQTSTSKSGPNVFVISSDTMGKGDDELGAALMKAFIHTILNLDYLPDTLIFYNSGVKLTVKDSGALDDLKKLEEQGVEILVCGTCANFFNIKDDIAAGVISNMYDIAGAMSKAEEFTKPSNT